MSGVSFLAYLGRQDYAGDAVVFVQCGLEKRCKTCCCAFGQLAEQFSIIAEIAAEDLGDAENVLPVRYGIQDVFLQMSGKLDYFFSVT